MKHILLIDDDEEYQEVTSFVLEHAGYSVTSVPCPTTAFELLESTGVDLILCDLLMPFSSGDDSDQFAVSYEVGFRTAKELAGYFGPGKVVVLSHLPQSDLVRIARFLVDVPFFSKPTASCDILTIVRGILEHESVCLAMQ